MNTIEQLNDFQAKQMTGKITYAELLEIAKPLIDQFNEKSARLAKMARKRPMSLSFEKLFGKNPE